MSKPQTLFEKIWNAHVVTPETPETPGSLYVDLHLIHEVTSPQAFSVLRERGIKVRRPERTVATMGKVVAFVYVMRVVVNPARSSAAVKDARV